MNSAVPFRVRITFEPLGCDRAHPRHYLHAEHDVNGIGYFEADFCERRSRRSHKVGNDEHRTPAHRALEHALQFAVGRARFGPVVGWSRFFFRRRANQRELLDARNVVRIRTMQIGARHFLLVQLDQHLLTARFSEQIIIFALGAIAPEDVLRLAAAPDFLHPIQHDLIGRLRFSHPLGRKNGRGYIIHKSRPARGGRDVYF